jgi:tetratricopeptide (TPR) repeat protein
MSAYEGDMLPASEDLNTSIAFFKKKNMYFEEAEAYYLLGNIHRISGIYDTAEFMLRTSLKIYSCIESAKGQAEVLGTLGLLMCVQNRFEEAYDYYNKAYKTAQGYRNLQEFIVVQQTMLDFLKNDKKQAVKRADKILKSTNNKIVKASILDILSRISISEKKYIKAAKYSFESSQEFFTNKNYPAGLEAYYLYASALFEGGKFNESEQVLRDLIKKEKQHPGCFHIANAYTLLGLVLLKNKEFDRAKAIFNQSLSKEFYNNRKTGVAIDYANLAVVEKSLGNNDESVKNIEKALSQIAGIDDELYNKIKAMLD